MRKGNVYKKPIWVLLALVLAGCKTSTNVYYDQRAALEYGHWDQLVFSNSTLFNDNELSLFRRSKEGIEFYYSFSLQNNSEQKTFKLGVGEAFIKVGATQKPIECVVRYQLSGDIAPLEKRKIRCFVHLNKAEAEQFKDTDVWASIGMPVVIAGTPQKSTIEFQWKLKVEDFL